MPLADITTDELLDELERRGELPALAPPRRSLFHRLFRQASIDDDGRIRLPLWMILVLTAVGEAIVDFINDVSWETVLTGLIASAGGMFAAGKTAERAAQAYAGRAAEWGGAVVAAQHASVVDEVLDGILPRMGRPTRIRPIQADEPPTS